MIQNPSALVEKQRWGPSEEPVDSAFDRPIIKVFVPNDIKYVETENQHKKQPHVEQRLISLVGVKLFDFLSGYFHFLWEVNYLNRYPNVIWTELVVDLASS